jgi:alcohol dehydrogenase class IV
LGIPASLQELGLTKEELKPIHADACTYRMRPRSPRKFSDAELFSVLEAAWYGDIKKAALI